MINEILEVQSRYIKMIKKKINQMEENTMSYSRYRQLNRIYKELQDVDKGKIENRKEFDFAMSFLNKTLESEAEKWEGSNEL